MAKSRAAFPQLPPQERAFPPRQMTCKVDLMGRMGISRCTMRAKKLVVACIGGDGACASSGSTLVEAMREAQPYSVAHRGSTFVVVLSTEIIDSPHLPSILEVERSYRCCLSVLIHTLSDHEIVY